MTQMGFRVKYGGLLSVLAAFCTLFLANTQGHASWTSGGPDNTFVLGLAAVSYTHLTLPTTPYV